VVRREQSSVDRRVLLRRDRLVKRGDLVVQPAPSLVAQALNEQARQATMAQRAKRAGDHDHVRGHELIEGRMLALGVPQA
jgi:hypothetical protein